MRAVQAVNSAKSALEGVNYRLNLTLEGGVLTDLGASMTLMKKMM